MPDFQNLEFPDVIDEPQEISPVLGDYLKHIVNKKLRLYKQYLHTEGEKQGQSLYSHVMDLVTFVDRLFRAIGLNDIAMRCVLLALTVHDINKIPIYGQDTHGRRLKYADAATEDNIRKELKRLNADAFFPEWEKKYLLDIVYLAHAHQAASTATTRLFNQAYIDRTQLKSALIGPLKFLMQATDASDNSHSGNYLDPNEVHLRDKVLIHINGVMSRAGRPYDYRFIGHRLAELRGIFTNVLHTVLVDYFREQYGELACIDIQYYPEGVNYLLDRQFLFTWNDEALHDVAKRVEQKLRQIQMKQLEQFVRGQPAAVVVNAAAMQIGAPLSAILEAIMLAVMRKQYTEEQLLERRTKLKGDLEAARHHGLNLDEQDVFISDDETVLKRGEFVAAYRKFLADHCAEALKTTKQTAWLRAYHLFGLPESRVPLYECINPYRRGHFLAADLPAFSLEDMKDLALADLAQLYPTEGLKEEPSRIQDIEDYLRRHLEVWDSANPPVLTALRFGDNLREYANPKRLNGQCCHCGTSLPASEWMAKQVPPRMSVQQFSNRLEGGSAKDPKRNVCEVCRMQFILEKLAWHGHRDKQEAERTTFYLHLFPFAFFTRPLLRAWWLSVEKLKDADHSAFFLETKEYFRLMRPFQTELRIQGFRTTTNGLNLPTFSDAISTTPILPIVAPGENYGLQFLLALEKAVVLVGWFECRAILSRSPLPALNLAREKREKQPVVLLVEGAPRNMQWLVPQTSLTRETFEILRQKLSLLHQLEEKLFYPDPQRKKEKDLSRIITHDFAAAAADDPLALYFQADRAIEAKVAAEKGGNPEFQAIDLSRAITPLLNELLALS